MSLFMGELESVCRGLRVPASEAALEPPEPPLVTELLGPELTGRSGDWGLSLTGDPGPGETEEDPAWSAWTVSGSWMLAGRELRHLLVRASRLVIWLGRGAGNRLDLRPGNPC